MPTRLKGRWVAGLPGCGTSWLKRLPRPVTWPEAEPQGPVLPDEAAGRPGLRAGQLHRAARAEAAVLAWGQGPWGARCRTRCSPLAALDVAPGPDPRCCAWPGHSGLGPRLAAAACVGQPEVHWGIVSPDWPTLAWRSCLRVVGAGRPHWAARGALQRFSQMDQLPTSLCSGVLRARVELEPWDGPLLVHRGPWPWGGGFRVPPTARSEAGGQPEAVPCWLLCPCIHPGSGTQPGGPGNTQAPVLTSAPTASLPSPQAPEPRRGAAGCGWGTQVSGSHVRATNCQRFGLSQTSRVCPESWRVCCPQHRSGCSQQGPRPLGGAPESRCLGSNREADGVLAQLLGVVGQLPWASAGSPGPAAVGVWPRAAPLAPVSSGRCPEVAGLPRQGPESWHGASGARRPGTAPARSPGSLAADEPTVATAGPSPGLVAEPVGAAGETVSAAVPRSHSASVRKQLSLCESRQPVLSPRHHGKN